MKITAADREFSWCVRERSNWTCERCGKKHEPPTKALHCSHFFGRGNWAVRFNPLNAFSHCMGCHLHFESNPHEFQGWVTDRLGAEGWAKLQAASEDVMLGKVAHRKSRQIAAFYRKELDYMRLVRSRGNQGRIDFADYFEENP